MIYIPSVKINKYSLNGLKAGIDSIIEYYLILECFEENLKLNHLKIVFIVLAILCAGLSHLFSRSFPKYYYYIIFMLIFYFIFKSLYYFIEKILTGNTFYRGSNLYYLNKNRKNKYYTIKEVKIHSQIDEKNPYIYEIWFEFITAQDNKVFLSEKEKIDCTKVYDERGYINKFRVVHSFKSFIKRQLKKIE